MGHRQNRTTTADRAKGQPPRTRFTARRASCLLSLALVAATVAGCSDGSGPEAPKLGEGDSWGSLTSGEFHRRYVLHVPPEHDPAQPAPLLILFHGYSDTGLTFKWFTGIDQITDPLGYLVVYPDGVQGSWAAGCDCTTADELGVDDVQFVEDLIGALADSIAIDSSRIYVAGFSQGAQLVHHLSCSLADRLAGAASVGATMSTLVSARCQPARPLSMLFIQGTLDPTFPWNGIQGLVLSMPATVEYWVQANGCDVEPEQAWIPNSADDGTHVLTQTYTGCEEGVEVKLYVVDGGGHTWPSSTAPLPRDRFGRTSYDISASEQIVEFLRRHTRG